MEEIISLPDNVIQLCNRTLGLYASTYLGNDTFYLNRATRLLISFLGEDWMEKNCPNYKSETQEKLERLNKKLKEVKTWYDAIEDKTFDKKNAEVNIKRHFLKIASKISSLESPLYNTFMFLNRRTSLHKNSIPTEAFRVLEHRGFKKLELGQRPESIKTEQIQKPTT